MKRLYGIWSAERGWWYTYWQVFHTDNYAIALAQLDVVQRNFARIFDTVIHYEIRPLPGQLPAETEKITNEPTRD